MVAKVFGKRADKNLARKEEGIPVVQEKNIHSPVQHPCPVGKDLLGSSTTTISSCWAWVEVVLCWNEPLSLFLGISLRTLSLI
jgi:hypothetical protein